MFLAADGSEWGGTPTGAAGREFRAPQAENPILGERSVTKGILERRIIGALLLCTVIVVSGCASPDVTIDVQRCSRIQRLAILPLTDGPGLRAKNSGNAVAGFVLDKLTRSGRFRVIERSKLKAIMDEADMQAADFIDPDTAAKIGKLAGVDAVVTGSVSQYDYEKTVVHIYIIPIVSRTYRVGMSVRIIDVDGGAIIYANSASGSSGSNYTQAGRRAADKLFDPLFRQVKPAPG